MSSHDLPDRPHLDHLKNEAKALLKAFHAGDATAARRIHAALGVKRAVKLTDAQRVIAREHQFTTWAQLHHHVEASRSLDEDRRAAANLAFAVIRFAQGAAPLPRGYKSAGVPRLGEDMYVFAPESRRVRRDEVPGILAGLPSPAVIYPTMTRAVVAVQLLSELSGDRAAAARKELTNQRENLADMLRPLGLTAESRVLLEFGEEAHAVSLAALRLWSERFAVQVGWNVTRLAGSSRASARLNLFRSDGVTSDGRRAQ